MPSKADPQLQRIFLENTLQPLIEQAKSGLCKLFFFDASHFVMGGLPGKVWSFVRKYVRTSSGRKRFNVMAGLDFITKELITVCNDTYINADSVIELLGKIRAQNLGKHIFAILDNAAYQRCKKVKEYAESIGITLIFLPTYSPNLNLIERVWKFVKSNVLCAAYFLTFEEYKVKIMKFINTLHIDNIEKMDSLISEKFHILDKISIIN